LTSAKRDSETDAAGFVLAGGRSSRMGRDKALVQFAGRPLVAHALSLLHNAGIPASIAGSRSTLTEFSPVIEDEHPDQGPLSGICAALKSGTVRWAVFVPIDLPLLPVSLINFMLDHARTTAAPVTLASVNGFAQTFPAILNKATLSPLLTELQAGRSGCLSAFRVAAASLGSSVSVLAVESLVQSGRVVHPDGLPASRWFLNVNAPHDLLQAQSQRAVNFA
jgi:molybdenum cofactor guanylyltransferase